MVRYWITLIIFLLASSTSFGARVIPSTTFFDRCLMQAVRQEHRLNRLEAIQNCFEKNKEASKKTLTIPACFATVEKIKLGHASLELSEQLKSLCFYEVGAFPNIKACLNKSQVFVSAINKDEAVFECYRTFQNELSTSQCLHISTLLKYPLKRDHLVSQCYN